MYFVNPYLTNYNSCIYRTFPVNTKALFFLKVVTILSYSNSDLSFKTARSSIKESQIMNAFSVPGASAFVFFLRVSLISPALGPALPSALVDVLLTLSFLF